MNESYTPFEPQGSQAVDKASTTDASSETKMGPATEDLKTAARATVNEYRSKAEQAWGDAQERVRSLHKESEQYVRENPTRAIFSVLGIGFLLGIIFRR
jgi:ElaB/YqjD/DUF883 family membrane-anchored ribosome-binding protein